MSGDRLRTIRRAGIGRRDSRSAGDSAYLFYIAVLLLAIVGIPIVRAVVTLLAQPTVLNILQQPTADRGVQWVAAGILLTACLAGGIRGPALLPPFQTVAIAGTDLPRSVSLRRPFRVSMGLTAVTLLVPSMVIVLVVGFFGDASILQSVAFLLGVTLFSVITCTMWLWSQQSRPFTRILVATGLVVVFAAQQAVPQVLAFLPSAAIGALWPSDTSVPWWSLTWVALAAIVSAGISPRLRDALRGPDLLAQAHRWQSVGTLGYIGDFAGAFEQFRAHPSVGRRWRAVRSAPLPVQFFLADLLGTVRIPTRFIAAAAALGLSGFLMRQGMDAPQDVGWMLSALGALVGYLALGVFSDGFRHAADSAHAPAVYRQSTRQLVALHASLPALCALVFSGIGTVLASTSAITPSAPLIVGLLAVFLVTVRLYDTTKPLLPVALLTPLPTPAGDVSGLMIMIWQADAALLSLAVGAGAGALVAIGQPLAAGSIVVAVAAAGLLFAARRLHIG